MKETESETKESTKHCCGSGCRRMDNAEREEYGGAPIRQRMTQNNLANANRTGNELMEQIVSRQNMNDAFLRVKKNKGAGGVDGMDTEALLAYLKDNGGELRQRVLDGKYKPNPVRRVEIPKDNGKKRMLGIPTAVDRVIQQAIAQKLTPLFEPQFVETSYGFRPGRGCHDAVRKANEYLDEGRVWVVDLDLEKFFDTVNQSKLIEVLSRTIKDGRVISLIHKFMRSGAVWCGKFEETEMGVPQGGPLSPLLANIILNELDHELERRGHKFVRYADDMVIFCKSKASAKQALEHITPYIEKKLFLRVNREKTFTGYASKIKFLGFGFYKTRTGWRPTVHAKSKAKLKQKVKEMTSRRKVNSLEIWIMRIGWLVRGWVNYYKLADMGKWLKDLDKWMRRRIRMVFWKKWKRVRTRYRNLRRLGLNHDEALMLAGSRKGYWHNACTPNLHKALSNKRLQAAGFLFFHPYYLTVKA